MFTNHDHGLAARSVNGLGETAAVSDGQTVVSDSQMVIVCA